MPTLEEIRTLALRRFNIAQDEPTNGHIEVEPNKVTCTMCLETVTDKTRAMIRITKQRRGRRWEPVSGSTMKVYLCNGCELALTAFLSQGW